MAKPLKKATIPAKGAQPAQARKKLRWWWLVLLVGATLAAWVGRQFWLSGSAPQPPTISTVGLERAVAELIEKTLVEVRAEPRSGAAWGKLGMVLQHYEFKAEARSSFAHAEKFDPNEPRWPYLHGLLLVQDHPEVGMAKLRRAVKLCRDQPDSPRLRLAQTLTEHGQFKEAEQQYRQLLRVHASHALALLGMARLSYARGRLVECTNYLHRCLTDPHTAKKAHTLFAAAERNLGNASAAAAATRMAAALPPDQDWPDPFLDEAAQYHVGQKALLDRGQLLLQQGRREKALPVITRAVSEYPDAAEGWLLLGRARLEQSDCAAAEQASRRHLALAPESVNGHSQLGIALLCQERYAEAAACFEKAIQGKPDFGEAHFNLGFARARSGQPTQAIECFRNAIRYSPDFVDPYITLADLLNQSGQKAEALLHLRRALELNPSDERAKALLERVQEAR